MARLFQRRARNTIIKALAKPGTWRDIQIITEYTVDTLRRHLNDMHEKNLVHIVGYKRHVDNPSSIPLKIYALGIGEDVVYQKQTQADRRAYHVEYNKKRKTEETERGRRRNSVKKAVKKALSKQNTPFSALFDMVK